MLMNRIVLFLILLIGLQQVVIAADIPEALEDWVPWVLHDHKDYNCPHPQNQAKPRLCAWPGKLALAIEDDRGRFAQDWTVYAESWVVLPGSIRHWPQDVSVNGKPATVTAHNQLPSLRLPAGEYEIRGRFVWDRTPERMRIPPATGLISLARNGEAVDHPHIRQRGQIWLQQKATGTSRKGDSLALTVMRQLEDSLPQKLITRLELEVSGKAREISLADVLPEGFTGYQLNSPIPARLDKQGDLRLQIRPGKWQLELIARSDQLISSLSMKQHESPWPENEVWVFRARHDLRQVEPEGLTRIDPRQTRLPPGWQSLPAYSVTPGDTLTLRELNRGDQQAYEDQLSLNRQIWLDFNGQGMTIRDDINGRIHRTWRMATSPELELGQVQIDGQPQFITRLPDQDNPGFEIRNGNLSLQADSRYTDTISSIPANGWSTDFQSVSATLNLPPGWRLFSATGVDNLPDTWLQRWTLLDIFLVLITTIASARLFGLAWGGVVLLALGLSWHEWGAPQYAWLNLLAITALIRMLPQGRFRNLASSYRWVSLIVLLLIGLPFLVDQVRTAIYPQLEYSNISYYPQTIAQAPRSSMPLEKKARALEESVASIAYSDAEVRKQSRLDQVDPTAQIQTGPGLPDWRWRQIPLNWSGPVKQGQMVDLKLLPPLAVSVIKILTSLLIVLAALRIADIGRLKWPKWRSATPATLLLALLCAPWPGSDLQAATFPGPELLEELRQRLLEPEKCLPNCAQISSGTLLLEDDTLSLDLEIHVQSQSAIPVPASPSGWMPDRISNSAQSSLPLYRDNTDQFFLVLDAGVHNISLSGPVPALDQITVHFPLVPGQLSVKAPGWEIRGLLDDQRIEPSIDFIRFQKEQGTPSELSARPLPGLARVERNIQLGLDWYVENRITRQSPAGEALRLNIPLIPGESVTTPGITVSNDQAQIVLAPGQRTLTWSSRLDKQARLELTAPDSLKHDQVSWSEVWRLNVSPIWHIEHSGLPVIHQSPDGARWLPEWRPWPGERMVLDILRPDGVAGQTLTIEGSTLTIRPGKRATSTELDLSLRSSQGGQHAVMLPTDAQLQKVMIDGRSLALGMDAGKLVLPIEPGTHEIHIAWQDSQTQAIRMVTPEIDLGTSSVNARITVEQGNDRWVLLTGGPLQGPAVLFWGVVLVLIGLSLGMGLLSITPLKNWHWFLLFLGMTQTPVWLGLIVVSWLLLLGLRGRMQRSIDPGVHNAMQLGLAIYTLVALSALFFAVQQGLLGLPEMQISGNQSSGSTLNWYQDRSDQILPQAWTISVPLLAYRLLMLAWALWLAFALLHWLRWGWQAMNHGGLWLAIPPRKRKPKSRKPVNKEEASNATDQDTASPD